MSSINIGVGTDIEKIDRFSGKSADDDRIFLEKIYTKKELDYCFSQAKPEQHLAVRYAGKESVIKALSTFGKRKLQMTDIEILNDANGFPVVNLHGISNDMFQIRLSLSHSSDDALAFVVVFK